MSEDWSICCMADVELTPEEQDNLYIAIDNNNVSELQWKCLGRRAPSPINREEPKLEEFVEKETPTKTDFDFMDDVALPAMRVRSQNSMAKGSSVKKKANFAGVLDALKKQMLNQ